MSKFYLCVTSLFFLSAVNAQTPNLRLNEILSNPAGTDAPYEFVEIKGVAGANISNVYFVSIESDNGGGTGTADMVTLVSTTVGSNGLIMIKAPGATNGFSPAVGTTVVEDAQLATGGTGIENGSTSFLLIYSPTNAIVENTDYDSNNDGTLELPAGAVVIDAVAFSDGGSNDVWYGGVVLATEPGAAVRFPNNNTASSASAWYWGQMTGTNSSVTFSSTNRSPNFPAGGELTPGSLNGPGANAPLAVSFTSFSAKRNQNKVILTWTTDTETDNKGFDIERKNSQTGSFERVGFVASKASNGNSTFKLSYEFTETNLSNNSLQYRLRQIDLNGQFKYSDIRIIDGLNGKAKTLVYPNPSQGNVNVVFNSVEPRNITLFDISGRAQKTWNNYAEQSLQLANLKPGIYNIRIEMAQTKISEIERIVIK